MKYFIAVIFVITFNLSFSQPGGGGQRNGGGRSGGQMNNAQQQNKIPEFSAIKAAGIFSLNENEAIKKIRIKNDDKLELKVIRAISAYNMRMDELTLLNTENFDSINVFMNAMRTKRQTRGNRTEGRMENEQNRSGNNARRQHSEDDDDPIRNYMRLSREKIKVVQTNVLKEEELLNTELKAILNDKQFKKWIKYQTKLKKDNAPKKEPSQSQNQNSGNRNGRQGGPPGGGNRF